MSLEAPGLAAELAAGVRRLAAPFVVITGGKGGVGKSTLAANLGVDLARSGRRVLLVDLDLGLANLDVLLRARAPHDVEAFLSGERRLRECVAVGPAGVHLVPAGSGSHAMGRPDGARRARLLDGLAELSREYELVLGDGAAGIGTDGLAFACAADHALLVTTPEPAALTDAYGVVKALHAWSIEQGLEVATPEVVVNLVGSAIEAEATASRLDAVCRRFLARSPRFAGWLPVCRAVRRAATSQRPFVLAAPGALSSRCLERLSRRVLALAGRGVR